MGGDPFQFLVLFLLCNLFCQDWPWPLNTRNGIGRIKIKWKNEHKLSPLISEHGLDIFNEFVESFWSKIVPQLFLLLLLLAFVDLGQHLALFRGYFCLYPQKSSGQCSGDQSYAVLEIDLGGPHIRQASYPLFYGYSPEVVI